MSQPENQPRSLAALIERPDFLTLAGLLSAFLAMAAAIREQFALAAGLLLTAVVADLLDGKVARAFGRRNHDFGAALDTVSDAVAFGAAPALFGLCAGLDTPIGLMVLSLYLAAAVLRLARFQSSPKDLAHYTGMPVPYGSVAVALAYFTVAILGAEAYVHVVLMFLFPLLGGLMVSTVRWPKF